MIMLAATFLALLALFAGGVWMALCPRRPRTGGVPVLLRSLYMLSRAIKPCQAAGP